MTQPERAANASQMVEVQLEGDWSSGADQPVLPANVFVTQMATPTSQGRPDGIYLWAGQMSPPLALGPPDQVKRMLADLEGRLPVTVQAKLLLTRDRAQELAKLLADVVEKYDQISDGASE